jgi:two-component system LytT family sensor kinase
LDNTPERAGIVSLPATANRRRMHPRLLPLALLLATMFSLLFTVQGVLNAGGVTDARHLLILFGWQAIPWFLWVGLAIPAFRLMDRFELEARSMPHALLFHLVLGSALALVHAVLTEITGAAVGLPPVGLALAERIRTGVRLTAVTSLVEYALLAIGYHLVRREIELRRSREIVERREAQLAAARLEALQQQLRPHFLFNTLNAAAAAARTGGGPAAAGLIAALGDLLRRAIELGDRQEVCLDDELAFLDRYLLIQRARFGDRISVHLDVDPASRMAAIPPLLVQTLVENAIKHGLERLDAPGEVVVRSRIERQTLVLQVLNDGPRVPPETTTPGNGTGIRNARARLQQLYGDAARFTLAARTDGAGTVASVELPLRAP